MLEEQLEAKYSWRNLGNGYKSRGWCWRRKKGLDYVGTCRHLQTGFYDEMGSHFQGFTRKVTWSDLHFKEMILAAVLKITYRDQEQKQRTVRKLYSKEKQLAFSSPISFSWLFFWLSMWPWANHHISLGIHFLIYKKRKLVQRDFNSLSSSANMWTTNLHIFIKPISFSTR